MERILKKYTTIPDPLYVKRQADYQLKNIIDEMQRPGYVLVARQMGKTNLLLNAKRNLENSDRLIVYIDLSNLYEEEVDCYRSIIDTIIELNDDIFAEIIPDIFSIREKKTPPHNEYLRSLLLILKKFDGDIVIILDEIDALKSKSYSDNIFAQIRSNYFSRTNYNELERLTYILSGVIEPTELIKDKNKSPFNIGEKIYLDDFSFEEHSTFIYKSKLQISKDCSEYLFNWINGNPRITFDVCSEIEKEILKGNTATKELIDDLINNKYLVAFDIAPVDHIRELIKNNDELKEALKCIHSNKSSNITDEIKRKLYLYGIISSDFNSNLLIKNKIISSTLNVDWLNSLDRDLSLNNALSKYTNGFYNEAIGIFDSLLQEENSVVTNEQIRYYTGLSYYNLNDFDETVKHLDYEFETDVAFDSKVFLALSKLRLGDSDGIEILEEIAKSDNKNSITFFIAILNIAINTTNSEKALDYLHLITTATNSTNINKKEMQGLKTLSHFFKSNIFEKQHKISDALSENEIALGLSVNEVRPILLWNKISLLNLINEETEDTKLELANFISEQRLNFVDQKYYPISFNRINLPSFFNIIIGNNYEAFNILYHYISSNLLKGEKECLDLLVQHDNSIPELCSHILNNTELTLDFSHRINIYRILSLNTSNDKDDINFKLYLEEIIMNRKHYQIAEFDYMYMLQKTLLLFQRQKFQEVLSYSENILNIFIDQNDNLSNHINVVVGYTRFIAEVQLNFRIKAIESANKLLINLNHIREFIPEILDAGTAKNIKESATNIPFVKNNKIINPNNNQLTLKNQVVTAKYKNGKIVKSKFKHIEKDLLDGKCIIID